MISIQKKVEEVKKAIRLLAFQGYTILDLEDNMINKWNINDNKRDAENPVNLTFKANESDAENSTMFACDFTSNGFKMRDSGNNNRTQSGIYIAFAETPFKYSNAR